MFPNKNKIIIISAALALSAIGYYGYKEFFTDKIIPEVSPANNVNGNNSTSAIEIAPNVMAEVEEVAIDSNSPLYLNPDLKKPSLNRLIVIPDFYSVQATKIMSEKISGLITDLKKDPSSYVNWSDLAMRFKMLEDYKIAEEIWLYLSQAAPRVSDAFINLGDLYMYYFHDNAKAEPMFLKAVAVAPRSLESYSRIVDFYVTALNDKAAARKFLKDSIAEYPDMELTLTPLLEQVSP